MNWVVMVPQILEAPFDRPDAAHSATNCALQQQIANAYFDVATLLSYQNVHPFCHKKCIWPGWQLSTNFHHCGPISAVTDAGWILFPQYFFFRPEKIHPHNHN